MGNMDNKVKNKVSEDSFNSKINKGKEQFKKNSLKLEKKYELKIVKAKTKEEVKDLKREYKKKKILLNNEWMFKYNSIIDEKFYRKSVLIHKLSDAKKKYKKRLKKTEDKDKLYKDYVKQVKEIKKKYQNPISSSYRKNRWDEDEYEDMPVKVRVDSHLKKNIKVILLIFFAALITTIALDAFIKPFGIYNSGLRGITQTIYYSIKHYVPGLNSSLSHVFYFVANIPLVIFGWLKVGKKFTLYTLVYIGTVYLTSLLLDVTGIEDKILPFGKTSKDIYAITTSSTPDTTFKIVLPFIGGLIGGILNGIGIGLIYRAGGSTGGSKFIVTYISAKNRKSIGRIASIVSLFVITFGLIVNHIIIGEENVFTSFASAIAFSSLLFVFVTNWMVDKIFSKSKQKRISMITTKHKDVLHFLDVKMHYNYHIEVSDVKTGFWSSKAKKITFMVPSDEVQRLSKLLGRIDKKSIVSISDIDKVYGSLYTRWYE